MMQNIAKILFSATFLYLRFFNKNIQKMKTLKRKNVTIKTLKRFYIYDSQVCANNILTDTVTS